MSLVDFFSAKKHEPRYERRDVPYRPKREELHYSNALKLLTSFFFSYIWPHRLNLFFYLTFTTLSACSVYLVAYYDRIVVDDILVINAPTYTATERFARAPSPHPEIDSGDTYERVSDSRLRKLDNPLIVASREQDGFVSEKRRNEKASRRPPDARMRLFMIFIAYVSTIVFLNITTRHAINARHIVAHKMVLKLRNDLHRKIIGLSSEYHQQTTPGRLMSRILADVDIVQAELLNVVATVFSQTIMFIVGLVILFSLEWRCAMTVLLVAIPYSFILRDNQIKVRKFLAESRHSRSCLWGLVSQKLDAIKAIFTYGREKVEMINFFRLSSVMQRDSVHQQKLNASVGSSTQLLSTFTMQGILVYCALQTLDGKMTLGEMMFIYGASVNLFTPVIQLTQMSSSIANLLVVMQRVSATLQNKREILDAPDAVDFPSPVQTGIQIENMNFRYDDEGPLILAGINLNISKGEWLCIMGPSGSGKTTLINILARLYLPTNGRILIDNIPIDKIKLHSLHTNMSIVPQEAQIISGTVKTNIVYGFPDATPTQIMDAAKSADAHDFIMNLPIKYETIIGEKGMTLSGGQRQRISIARALITKPEILILDDCTSALDANTERKIQETLSTLLKGRTAVIVSQRVSMAMRCGRIAVLEDGHISELGSHAQLVHHGGFYSRLYAQQIIGKNPDAKSDH